MGTRWIRSGYAVATLWIRGGYTVDTWWIRGGYARGYDVATRWIRGGNAVDTPWLRTKRPTHAVQLTCHSLVGRTFAIAYAVGQPALAGGSRKGPACTANPPPSWAVELSLGSDFDWVPPEWGSGPYSEVVQYRDNPWLGRGKPLFHSPVPKISLIYELLNEQRIRY